MTLSRGRKGGIATRDSAARTAGALGLGGRRERGTGSADSEGGIEWEARVGRSGLVVVEVGRGEVAAETNWGGVAETGEGVAEKGGEVLEKGDEVAERGEGEAE